MHTYVTLHDSCLLNSSNWMIVALLGLLSLMVTHPDSRETGHSILTSLTERHCRIPQICIGSLLNSDFYSISYRLKSRDPSSPWVPCCLGIGIISIPSLHQPDHLKQKKLGHSLIQKSTNPSIHSKCSISIVTTMMSNYAEIGMKMKMLLMMNIDDGAGDGMGKLVFGQTTMLFRLLNLSFIK